MNTNEPSNAYFFQLRPKAEQVDTTTLFTICCERDKLHVMNENVNCLFSNLDPQLFNEAYNNFLRCLNPDFEPLEINETVYGLDTEEQECFIQHFITNWIYYYTINNLKIKVRRTDFEHPYTVD